jgi:hypothetical protein
VAHDLRRHTVAVEELDVDLIGLLGSVGPVGRPTSRISGAPD